MPDSRTFRCFVVGSLVTATAGVLAFSGWIFWPRLREYWAVRKLMTKVEAVGQDQGLEEAFLAVKEIRGGRGAVGPLLAAVLHDDPPACEAAAYYLSRVGPEATDAVPLLIEALKNDSYEIRFLASDILGGIGPSAQEAIPALMETLKDPQELVRHGSDFALKQIAPELVGKVDHVCDWAPETETASPF